MPEKRLFVYRHLVAVIALLAISGAAVSVFQLPVFWLVVFMLAGGFVGLIARSGWLVVLLVLIPVVFTFYSDWRKGQIAVDDLSKWRSARLIVIQGCVERSAGKELVISARKITYPFIREVSGRCLIKCAGQSNSSVGDVVEAKILMDKQSASVQIWEFNREEYLRKRGISQSARLIGELKVVAKHPDGLASFMQSVELSRKHLVETHCRNMGETEGALLTSMVIGDRAVNLPDLLVKQFRDVGLSHVLAASGFNLTIVTGCTLFIVRLLLKPIWFSTIFCLASMGAFVIMAGPSPSVLRSAFMLCFLLGYRTMLRQAPMSLALCGALVCAVLIEPSCLADLGFQLSYIATAAIVFGSQSFKGLIKVIGNKFGIAETIAVIVIAQLGVLPVQLYYFWCLGLFFLPANLLVAPMVHLVTLAGFTSSLLAIAGFQVPWLMHLVWAIDKITWYPLIAILACVRYMASFELAKLILGPPHLACLFFYYVAFVLFIFALQYGRWRITASALLIFALCILVWRPAPTCFVVGVFRSSLAVVDLRRQALVLGDGNLPVLKRFLLYQGVRTCKSVTEQIFIPQTKTLVVTVDDISPDRPITKEHEFETLILVLRRTAGHRPSAAKQLDSLLCNPQFSTCLQRGKPIWLVFDGALTKNGLACMAGRLPSYVKIAVRASESVVFEAKNESVEIRN